MLELLRAFDEAYKAAQEEDPDSCLEEEFGEPIFVACKID